MGNNHEQYFGKNKRKVLLLGLSASGKTSILNTISNPKNQSSQPSITKDLNIQDHIINDLNITFFDLAGSERQRVFWKQHYEGAQGIIFVVDSSQSDNIEASIKEILKLQKFDSLADVPLAICLNKVDLVEKKTIESAKAKIKGNISAMQRDIGVYETSNKKPDSVTKMLKWLLSKTKAL